MDTLPKNDNKNKDIAPATKGPFVDPTVQPAYFFESSAFRNILYCIFGLIVILLAFRVGTIVGYQKALFSMHSSDNYEKIFLGPHHGDGIGFINDDFPNANGMIGQIMEINGNTLILKAENQTEKSVEIGSSTLIRQFQNNILLNQLKPGDIIAVIGSPNNFGQIEADLIRYLPPKPEEPSGAPGGGQ